MQACKKVGVLFVPLVAESLGGRSIEVVYIIKSIGSLQGQRLGIDPTETTHHLSPRQDAEEG